METIYVRFAPGISIEDSAKLITKMGQTLSAELPKGSVDLVFSNIGSPANARAIITSPNWGPHMGYLRVAIQRLRGAQAVAAPARPTCRARS